MQNPAIFAGNTVSMIKSMTGYGRHSLTACGKIFSAEIRALNSRNFEVNVRLPTEYRELEPRIKTILLQHLERGKIDFSLAVENQNPASAFQINRNLARFYFDEIYSFAQETGINPGSEILPAIFRMPDVIVQPNQQISEDEKSAVMNSAEHASMAVNEFRIREGAVLASDISHRIQAILTFLKKTESFEANRIKGIRDRLQQ